MSLVKTGSLLIDGSCATSGYVEDLRGELSADSVQLARLCTRFGVGALRDIGSGRASALRLAAVTGAPRVVGGLWVLTDGDVRTRDELYVRSIADLADVVASCHLGTGSWIGVRSDDPEFFAAVREVTAPVNAKLAGRGVGALSAACAGHLDMIEGVSPLVGGKPSPIEVLVAASMISEGKLIELTERVGEAGVAVATELMALRRSVFLKEAIYAPFLEELVPIIPHAEHLRRMRQGVGYLAGRRALEAHSGMREPGGSERVAAEEGWQVLVNLVKRCPEFGVRLLPASKAPQLSIVPGYGLLEELALLMHVGLPTEDVLHMATDGAAAVLGCPVPVGELAIPTCLTKETVLSIRSAA